VGAAQPPHLGNELEEPLYAHVAIAGRALGQVTHLPLGLENLGTDVETADGSAAAVRRQKAGKHLHGGGLAGTVGAKKAQDFPRLYLKGQIVHGDMIAKAFGQAVYLYHASSTSSGIPARRNQARAVK